jgi:hypothetical protein
MNFEQRRLAMSGDQDEFTNEILMRGERDQEEPADVARLSTVWKEEVFVVPRLESKVERRAERVVEGFERRV